jgi:hypothetical protein
MAKPRPERKLAPDRIAWIWIVSIVVGALILGAISLARTQLAGAINAAVVMATFLAVLWYAIETRELVEGQERATELDRHPWLEATNLRPERIAPPSEGRPLGGFQIWLPITNVGHTPAIDLEVDALTTVSNVDIGQTIEAREKRFGQTLVPRDVLHQEISRVFLEGPRTTIRVDVRIVYRTIDGGRADLTVGFTYTAEKGWRNLPTQYQFWLADGSHFPRDVTADAGS